MRVKKQRVGEETAMTEEIETRIQKMDRSSLRREDFFKAAEILRNGGLVAFPTDFQKFVFPAVCLSFLLFPALFIRPLPYPLPTGGSIQQYHSRQPTPFYPDILL